MAHWFRYYGTMNETVLEVDQGHRNEGVYLIQSPDLAGCDAEQISEVPYDFDLIPDDEATAADLAGPEDLDGMRVREGRSGCSARISRDQVRQEIADGYESAMAAIDG